MSLSINLKYLPKELPVLEIAGELDISSAHKLDQAISSLIQEGYSQIVLAMEEVDYLDSSGLRLLLEARRKLMDKGGKLHIMDPSARVLRVLSITRLLNSFSIVSKDSL
jgi:anti-sigma B factor antagonist